MAKVSIIIPIYNVGQFLRETLDSVIGQTFQDWTCLLVNDGSTDDSQSIVDDYCRKDGRFVSYVKENEGSPDLARKLAFEKATTEWAVLLDADDVIEASYLEKDLLRQKQTEADVICSTMIVCQEGLKGESYRFPERDFDSSQTMTGREAFACTIGGWEFPTGGMFFRLCLTENLQHGGYINSDEFVFRQILFNANRVAFSDAEYYYRNNDKSISRKLTACSWQNLKVNQQVEDFVWSHFPNTDQVCSKAVQTNFLSLVNHSSKYWLKRKSMPPAERRLAKNWLREAYDGLNTERLSSCFPKHYKLFFHGFWWFGFMSVLYVWRKS